MEKELLNTFDKELLLKDLCARLPYGIKFLRESWNFETDQEMSVIEVLEDIDKDGYINNTKVYKVEDIKPYLFPLSSMTEKQEKEYNLLRNFVPIYYYGFDIMVDKELYDNWESIDYLNAHHFDYRGLIEKGLAIDATNLNIY